MASGTFAQSNSLTTLTLSEALARARTNDQLIAIARGEENINQLAYRQSRKAFGPTVSLEGSYGLSEETDPADEFISKMQPSEAWNGWVRVSQSLLDARLFPAERSEKHLLAASRFDYTNTVRTRLFLVAASYYRTLQAEAMSQAAKQALDLSRDEVRRAELRVKAGEARQTDHLRAQVDEARAERVWNEAKSDLTIAARNLYRFVGLPPDAVVSMVPPAPWPEPGTESLSDLFDMSRRHRSDIAAARERIEVAREKAKVANSDRMPRIQLQYQHRVAEPEIFAKGADTWDASLVAQFDLWDKGRKLTTRLQEIERIEQERQRLIDTEKSAEGETERALAELSTARLSFQTAQREAALAEETYRQLSEQARNGLATGLDVSTALVDLTRARMERTRLQYQVEIAKLALQTAIGQFPEELGVKP